MRSRFLNNILSKNAKPVFCTLLECRQSIGIVSSIRSQAPVVPGSLSQARGFLSALHPSPLCFKEYKIWDPTAYPTLVRWYSNKPLDPEASEQAKHKVGDVPPSKVARNKDVKAAVNAVNDSVNDSTAAAKQAAALATKKARAEKKLEAEKKTVPVDEGKSKSFRAPTALSLKRQFPANGSIRPLELSVTKPDGESAVMATASALALAANLNLDLVLVDPRAAPPAAQFLDYERFIHEKLAAFEAEKRGEREAVRALICKELRTRARSAEGDLEVKVRRAEGWLQEGHRVSIAVVYGSKDENDASRTCDQLLARFKEQAVMVQPKQKRKGTFTAVIKTKPVKVVKAKKTQPLAPSTTAPGEQVLEPSNPGSPSPAGGFGSNAATSADASGVDGPKLPAT